VQRCEGRRGARGRRLSCAVRGSPCNVGARCRRGRTVQSAAAGPGRRQKGERGLGSRVVMGGRERFGWSKIWGAEEVVVGACPTAATLTGQMGEAAGVILLSGGDGHRCGRVETEPAAATRNTLEHET
jgi:hypothetical protein